MDEGLNFTIDLGARKEEVRSKKTLDDRLDFTFDLQKTLEDGPDFSHDLGAKKHEAPGGQTGVGWRMA